MRDYSNLITALRICEDLFNRRDAVGVATLYRDAADAIEELLAKDTNVPNKWISVEEEGLPKTYFKGYPSQEEFLVVVADRWSKREEWEYHVDSALNWGTYIDDFWDTKNDWHEGQEVHVVAYMPFPEPLRRPPKGVE